MIDRVVFIPELGQAVIGTPLSGLDHRPRASVTEDEGFQRSTTAPVADLRTDHATLPAHHDGDGGTVGLEAAVTPGFVGTAARRIRGVRMPPALLAGVLIDFVQLHHRTVQELKGGKALFQERLNAPSHFRETLPGDTGQVFGGHPLGHVPKQEYEGGHAVPALGEKGPEKQVVDRTTDAAAVIQQGRAMAVVGRLAGWERMSTRALRPPGWSAFSR